MFACAVPNKKSINALIFRPTKAIPREQRTYIFKQLIIIYELAHLNPGKMRRAHRVLVNGATGFVDFSKVSTYVTLFLLSILPWHIYVI